MKRRTMLAHQFNVIRKSSKFICFLLMRGLAHAVARSEISVGPRSVVRFDAHLEIIPENEGERRGGKKYSEISGEEKVD